MDYSSGRGHGCRIMEFTHRGLRTLSMENELIKVLILLDKGTDIVELAYKPKDIDFMWKGPGGIRDTSKLISSSPHSWGNFLDYYPGGWQEILPGGGPGSFSGAELGLHGEVCLLPWDFCVEEDNSDRISVLFTCRTIRFPFFIKKRLKMTSASAVITIEKSIINESNEEIEFMWGHHPAIGKPFLDGSCRIDIPAKNFIASDTDYSPTSFFPPNYEGNWPKDKGTNEVEIDLSYIPPDDVQTGDLFYLYGLKEGWYALTNTSMKLGIGLCWDVSIFPYVWYWQVCKGLPGYPWFGRTYNIALEPWTSMPSNIDEAKAKRATCLIKGYEKISTELKVVIYEGLEKMESISSLREIR